MAETLGIVASVIQVAGAGLKLSQTLYQYADSVASADRRIKDVATEIQLTAFVIEELGSLFKQDATSTLLSENALKTADETVRECSTVFGELDAALKKTKKNTFGRLMLPFREPKIELMRSHVDKLKSTLQLLLQVLTHAHQVAAQKLDREAEAAQRDHIKALLQNNKESTKRYEESLKNYSASEDSTLLDEDVEKDMSTLSSASTMVMTAAATKSSITVRTLATCVQHVQSLLSDIEALQHALENQQDGSDHSEQHHNLIGSYFRAREHLDQALLGNAGASLGQGSWKKSANFEPANTEIAPFIDEMDMEITETLHEVTAGGTSVNLTSSQGHISLSEQTRTSQRESRAIRLNDIKKFSQNFKLDMPVSSGHIQIPVDVQAAAKVADEKRKRNPEPSARLQERRRERERDTQQGHSQQRYVQEGGRSLAHAVGMAVAAAEKPTGYNEPYQMGSMAGRRLESSTGDIIEHSLSLSGVARPNKDTRLDTRRLEDDLRGSVPEAEGLDVELEGVDSEAEALDSMLDVHKGKKKKLKKDKLLTLPLHDTPNPVVVVRERTGMRSATEEQSTQTAASGLFGKQNISGNPEPSSFSTPIIPFSPSPAIPMIHDFDPGFGASNSSLNSLLPDIRRDSTTTDASMLTYSSGDPAMVPLISENSGIRERPLIPSSGAIRTAMPSASMTLRADRNHRDYRQSLIQDGDDEDDFKFKRDRSSTPTYSGPVSNYPSHQSLGHNGSDLLNENSWQGGTTDAKIGGLGDRDNTSLPTATIQRPTGIVMPGAGKSDTSMLDGDDVPMPATSSHEYERFKQQTGLPLSSTVAGHPAPNITDYQSMVTSAGIDEDIGLNFDMGDAGALENFDFDSFLHAKEDMALDFGEGHGDEDEQDTVDENEDVTGEENRNADFASTVVAGMKESGFFPDLSLRDPSFNRQTSPPRTGDGFDHNQEYKDVQDASGDEEEVRHDEARNDEIYKEAFDLDVRREDHNSTEADEEVDQLLKDWTTLR